MNRSIAWAAVGILVVAMAGCGGEKETPTNNSGVMQGRKGKRTSHPAAKPAAEPAVANNDQQNAAPQQPAPAPAGLPAGAATPAPAAAQGGAAPLNLLNIGGDDDSDQKSQISQPIAGGAATLPQPVTNQGGAAANGQAAPNGTRPPGGIAAGGPVALVPMVVPTKVSSPQQALAVFSFQLLNRIQMRIAKEQGPIIALPNVKGAPGNGVGPNVKSQTVDGQPVLQIGGD